MPKKTAPETVQQPAERTAYWGTCPSCLTSVVVYPHPDRDEDLPEVEEWERGFPSECPVCDESLDWEGSDPAKDIRL